MVERPPAKRRGGFVPLEVGPFLRAPFGWTNRMRRAEGWPERGASRHVPIGLWGNLALGLALYGGPCLGALLGWRLWGGLIGAAVGLVLGVGLGIAIMGLVALAWSQSRPASDGDEPGGPRGSA